MKPKKLEYYFLVKDNKNKLILQWSLFFLNQKSINLDKNAFKEKYVFIHNFIKTLDFEQRKIHKKEEFEVTDLTGSMTTFLLERISEKLEGLLNNYEDPYLAMCDKYNMSLTPSPSDTGMHILLRKHRADFFQKRTFKGKEFYSTNLHSGVKESVKKEIIHGFMDDYEGLKEMVDNKKHIKAKLIFKYEDVLF